MAGDDPDGARQVADETRRPDGDELFGPVLAVESFDTEDQAVALANCTPFGRTKTVWLRTSDDPIPDPFVMR